MSKIITNKDEFMEIVLEYGISESLAERLWEERPKELLAFTEDSLRTTCTFMRKRFNIADKMNFLKNTLTEWQKTE